MIFAAVTAALSTLATASAQPKYEFEIIARQGDTVGGLEITDLATARINENGEIAFAGDSGSTDVIWSTTGVLLAEGQDIGSGVIVPALRQENFDFNNAGQVAAAGLSSSDGIFTSIGTAITPGSTIGGAMISGNFDINVGLADDGTVFFIADVETSPGLFTTTVFSSSTILAQEGQTIGGVTLTDIGSGGSNGTFGIDDAGNAIFYNNLDDPGPRGIVSTAGFGLEEGSPFPTGPLAGQTIEDLESNSFGLGVNGMGDIIARGEVGGVRGLYGQEGLLFADGVFDGISGILLAGVDLNDNGSFASLFIDLDTIEGIVVDGSLILTNLDTIEGFEIEQVADFSSIDINNNGDLVFNASLFDGNGNTFNAIVRGNLVPEPSSLALVSFIGLGGLLIARHRRD